MPISSNDPTMELFRLTPRDMRRVQKVIEYIDKNYSTKLSVEHLAIEGRMSKEKLQAGIQHKTGLTLHEYLVNVRIDKSKDLLTQTELPIKAIAGSTGFKKPGHFTDVFKALVRITPSEYRVQYGD